MNNEWLIVLDLDGTTLNHFNSIPKLNFEVITYLNKLPNYKIIIATGRNNPAFYEIYKLLNLNTYAISNTGSEIINFKTGETLYRNELAKQSLKKLSSSKFFKKYKFTLGSEDNFKLYATNHNHKIFEFLHIDFFSNYKIVEINDFIKKRLQSFVIIPQKNNDVDILVKWLKKTFIEWDIYKFSTKKYFHSAGDEILIDISNKNVNKYNAIELVRNEYKIKKDNVIYFGDSLNDQKAFENIKHTVAPTNALPTIRKIAKYTPNYSCHESFVGKFLISFFSLDIKKIKNLD